MKTILVISFTLLFTITLTAQENKIDKPRILISSDIGGTDPDDNQSMIHLLMYSDLFQIEGLVSSPSFGEGSKEEIIRMIDLYEKDLPKLKQHSDEFPTPEYLRSICKQGRPTLMPYAGYGESTEGSDWIIECAKKESDQPLWVLVWGGIADVAQALHDAPEIVDNIRVYWIGGPNKKFSAYGYSYIAGNFPTLWMIEANHSYYGFFSKNVNEEKLQNKNYYKNYIREAGYMGKAFKTYYDGNIKMGDTPSLLYVMNGDPENPLTESWGGSFEKINNSSRMVFNRNTTIEDTVTVTSILELHFKGPEIVIPTDSACFKMSVYAGIGEQKWDGYYLGDGKYSVRYCPKKAETISYKISSDIPGFIEQSGELVVDNIWPGKPRPTDFKLGDNWYSDSKNPKSFDGTRQGAGTILKWRNDALLDWAKRWDWLR